MAEATSADPTILSTKRMKIQFVIDSMLQRQKKAKIVGNCYMNACDLYDAIKINDLGEPQFVAGLATKKMNSKDEWTMKHKELNAPTPITKAMLEDRPLWAIVSHCWVELDGEILDASYEWNGTEMHYHRNYNSVLEEYGAEMTMQQIMFVLYRTNEFLSAWKTALPKRTPQNYRERLLHKFPNYDKMSQKEKDSVMVFA